MADPSAVQFTLRLTGKRPMLMHNGRLANPLDSYTRALKALTSKRGKTDEDLIELARLEARGGIYETRDGMVGMPNVNVWRCLYDAAKGFKRGEDIKRALSTDASETVPILFPAGKKAVTISADEYLTIPEHVDYASVRIQKNKVMRARPYIVANGWSSEHEFELFADVMDLRDLEPIVGRAGRLVGLCDYRPMYGTFEGEIIKR